MSQPTNIRYSAVVPRGDGLKLYRVQTLGVTTDKARDPISELGNSDVVQYIETNPSVSVSIDTNYIGSTDNMNIVMDNLVPRTGKVTKGAHTDPRYDGLTANRYLDKIITGHKNSASRSLTQDDIVTAYVDLMIPVTEDDAAVSRTMWIHRAAATGVTINLDVNGNASENYTLQGAHQVWFLGAWKNAHISLLTNTSLATAKAAGSVAIWDKQAATSQTFYGVASAIPRGANVLAVAINEKIFYKSKGWWFTTVNARLAAATSMAFGTAGTAFRMAWRTPGGSISASPLPFATPWALHNDKVLVVWSTPSLGWNSTAKIVSTAGSRGALARQHVNAYFWNTDLTAHNVAAGGHTVAGRSLRIQNVSIEVSPGSEELFELGNKDAYGIVRQTPVPVTLTMTVNDSDLRMWAEAAGKDYTTATQITLDDFTTHNQFLVDFFRDEARQTKVSTIVVNDMEVTGVRKNVSAGGNSTHEYTFLAKKFTHVGTGIDSNA